MASIIDHPIYGTGIQVVTPIPLAGAAGDMVNDNFYHLGNILAGEAIASGLNVSGSTTILGLSTSITTKTSNYTLTADDSTILLDGTSDGVTGVLPTAVGITGRVYNLKSINDTNQTDVEADGSEEIDGSTNNAVLGVYESIKLQSDGANWWIV